MGRKLQVEVSAWLWSRYMMGFCRLAGWVGDVDGILALQ